MAEIVRRRSWGGVLPLGRHVSISGSSLIQCASASMAPPHPGGAKCYPGEEVQGRTGPRKFAVELFGEAGAPAKFQEILNHLNQIGHLNGIIRVGKLYVRVSAPGDPFWRCPACERVHLHLGVHMCTRCHRPLSAGDLGGTVDDLWNSN